MPLKKFSVLITFLFIFTITNLVFAQGQPGTTTLAELKNSEPPQTPTSAEIMRTRISKAKAFLVVKNYGAAVYELENIRRETGDKTVHRVLDILLMHAYLEQGDYIKAQSFLKELHKSKGADAAINYLAVAGQVVSGARTQLERYKSLGLSVSDRNLPSEATSDVENMRKTLELIVTQSVELSTNKSVSANAFALLEETSGARADLAKDAFDSKRWKDQVADAREQLVNPNTKVINATGNPPINSPNVQIVAANEIKPRPVTPNDSVEIKKEEPAFNPVKENTETPPTKSDETIEKPDDKTVAKSDSVLPTDRKIRVITSAKKDDSKRPTNTDQPNVKSTIKEALKEEIKEPVENTVADSDTIDDGSPLTVGSLIGFATKRVTPVYPRQARNMRMTGTVTVEVVVDKDGNVTSVENTEGPSLLKRAASDAIRKWQFTPFERNGQPVEAKGFVSFNFNL